VKKPGGGGKRKKNKTKRKKKGQQQQQPATLVVVQAAPEHHEVDSGHESGSTIVSHGGGHGGGHGGDWQLVGQFGQLPQMANSRSSSNSSDFTVLHAVNEPILL